MPDHVQKIEHAKHPETMMHLRRRIENCSKRGQIIFAVRLADPKALGCVDNGLKDAIALIQPWFKPGAGGIFTKCLGRCHHHPPKGGQVGAAPFPSQSTGQNKRHGRKGFWFGCRPFHQLGTEG